MANIQKMIAANSMLMFSIHMGFVAFCYAANKEAMREYRFPRTVISSVSEKSFSFAVKQCMRVNKNGKPDIPRMWEYGVSCKRISRAGEEEDCNKDPSAALGMTMRKRSLPIPFYSAL